MADKRMATSELRSIICEATGLAESDLTTPKFRKKSKELALAWKECIHSKETESFIKEYKTWKASLNCKEMKQFFQDDIYDNVLMDVKNKLENISYKFIGEGGICNGWVTTGTYEKQEYKYYTKKQSEGVNALVLFITDSLTKDHEVKDAELDSYIEETLSMKFVSHVKECSKVQCYAIQNY